MMKRIAQNNLIAIGALIVCFVALYFVFAFSFSIFSRDKFYPGVSVAGIQIGGKSKNEAESVLRREFDQFKKKSLVISNSRSSNLLVADLGLEPDFSSTLREAMKFGRENPLSLGRKKDFSLKFNLNGNKIDNWLADESRDNNPVRDSGIIFKSGKTEFLAGKSGRRINYAETTSSILAAAGRFETNAGLAVFFVGPSFSAESYAKRETEVERKIKSDFTLRLKERDFVVTKKDLVSMVGFGNGSRSQSVRFWNDPLLEPLHGNSIGGDTFSAERVSDFLKNLAKRIDVSPKNAVLSGSAAGVAAATAERDGITLNVGESLSAMLTGLEAESGESQLSTDVTRAEIRRDNLEELGLVSRIAIGYSNFSGSPINRVHNVRTGAAKFNGVLIRPSETFSFIETLGPVDASTGYLPELVIKENKTVPEYGGGMCQVSSTAFRAALNAGLPIYERTYHAYPVQYYKPYGVDATVYIPKPDLVFKNDTGKYIFVQTKISGFNLYFEFYGTEPDRRIVFAGNGQASGGVGIVEEVTPYISEAGKRGKGSFTATFWRFIYNSAGKLVDSDRFVSKYDSPDKYPH